MTADLAEEHDTATHATEMLEAETADRMRLDKELKDVQVSRCHIMFEPRLNMMLNVKISGLLDWLSISDEKNLPIQVCNIESKVFQPNIFA